MSDASRQRREELLQQLMRLLAPNIHVPSVPHEQALTVLREHEDRIAGETLRMIREGKP